MPQMSTDCLRLQNPSSSGSYNDPGGKGKDCEYPGSPAPHAEGSSPNSPLTVTALEDPFATSDHCGQSQ